MAELLLPTQPGHLADIDTTQGAFRGQLQALTTLMRQVTGSADAAQDLLVSRYTLYVNPDIGRDTFVGGDVNAAIGLSEQMAACGYSSFAPFKSMTRAFIEAARISLVVGPGNDQYDRVVIKVASGNHIISNGQGGSVSSWGASYEPTQADLQLFNSSGRIGVIIPRGISVIGEDLRKTIIRPDVVPSPNGDPSTGRGAIFRATGGGFFFTFTFKDNVAVTSSHHMLHCFEFCSQAALNEYYDKVATAFGLTPADFEPRQQETQIAAPYETASATPATDTTAGSSCYVFSCSLRSDYGMCGIYLDGDEVTGFKSMVTAQFTNVSLQKDMNAWQLYAGNSWATPASYQDYIDANLNDVRYRVGGAYNPTTGCYQTDWRHFAFKCMNNAIIQEVSCFVIGNAVHHWTASGGECTITNSNSNFGATALLSSGFKGVNTSGGAFSQDEDFLAGFVRRPLALRQDGTNIRQISLGLVQSYDAATGTLTLDRAIEPQSQLGTFGYSLAPNTYLWIENNSRESGPGSIPGDLPNSTALPVRALMDGITPWVASAPDQVQVQVSTDQAVNNFSTLDPTVMVGNRVYIRRLVDNRTTQDREYSLTIYNSKTNGFRRPLGNYVVRLGSRSTVSDQLDPSNGSNELFLVTDATPAGADAGAGIGAAASNGIFRLVMRPGDSQTDWNNGQYYRLGQAIFANGRVKRSKRNATSTSVSGDDWENSVSMLPSERGLEQSRLITGPLLVVDRDSDPSEVSKTLGIDILNDSDVLDQIRSSPDFIATAEFMVALGYSAQDVGLGTGSLSGKVLQPQTSTATRNWDPRAATSPVPTGRLTSKQAWPLEFNRPSLIRAFGQAYEWAGFMNYTKSMPRYQTTVPTDQNKIDFFAVNHLGGRCYNTGFNEDGLLVQGDTIIDLSTGRTTSTDIAGLGGLSGDPEFEDIPNTFADLTVTDEFNSLGRANLNNVVLNGFIEGSPQWARGALPEANEAEAGIIRVATQAEATAKADSTVALTPFTWGLLGNIPLGWLELDANGLIPASLLPNLDGSLLPGATTTRQGIIEIATNAEALAGNDGGRALVPTHLNYLKNIANGLAGLDASGLVIRGVLPAATQADIGAGRYSTNPEAIAYALNTVGISPANIGYLRGRAGGLAGLDSTGKLPGDQLPTIPLGALPLAPVTWIANGINWDRSINFTWSHTTGATLQLGTPQPANYLGVSGFIFVTNTSTTPVTGINNAVWSGVLNTWIDPQTSTTGLSGNLLISYFIRSATEIIYNVSQVS